MTIVCEADDDKASRIEANLYKMVNVLWVDDITHKQSINRVLALIKVNCSREQRDEILKICDVFRARAIDMSPDRVTIEITGPQDKVEGLVSVLRPFGISGVGADRHGRDDPRRREARSRPPHSARLPQLSGITPFWRSRETHDPDSL